MAQDAFDLAERFQTPVFVMSDLDLGMNTWMSDPFAYPEKPLDRGKVLDAETLSPHRRLGPLQGRRRRRHSLPIAARAPACRRTSRAAPATTRRRNTASARTTSCATSIACRASSTPRAKRVPAPIVEADPAARVGIIAYGTSHWAIVESRDQLVRKAALRPAISGCARTRSRPRSAIHRRSRSRLRRRAEPRRPDARR